MRSRLSRPRQCHRPRHGRGQLWARGGLSSWYDFNFDGLTDPNDLRIITQNLGTDCRKPR
jgi:hypothetical protein